MRTEEEIESKVVQVNELLESLDEHILDLQPMSDEFKEKAETIKGLELQLHVLQWVLSGN